ncbi:MAG: TetR/AcrR family transcriptional regulator [Acinetobacter sp.]|jgi:AcrR family transcriptional regulator|nr:MAG: TetR/AcrR family transcriptional regulator [Acinetobacter sp.]
MTTPTSKPKRQSTTRQFKGLSLDERKHIRRDKLIAAGLQIYGTQGFFSVTIKDICHEAKLTERYFYESFKRSEELFKVVYLQLIGDLQQQVIQAVTQVSPHQAQMMDAGLTIFLKTLQNDPRIARILFIDALLVQELYGDTIIESFTRFNHTIFNLLTMVFPDSGMSHTQKSLIASGLYGYITQIAMKWVMGGFKQSFEDVLEASRLAYVGIAQYYQQKNHD